MFLYSNSVIINCKYKRGEDGTIKDSRKFTLDELCALVDVSRRTLRYYIQTGLVDRPEGTRRGAYYTEGHLSQLLEIKKWKRAGVSLQRIEEILHEEADTDQSSPPLPPPRPGQVAVWSHMYIADGIELNIEPGRAGLAPEQVQALFQAVQQAYEHIHKEE